MKQIYANNFTTLELGRKGENLARQVVFDVRDLESLYGPGDVEVIYQRPGDAQPYPLAVQKDGTLVTWDVTATDTEMSDGYGKCELRYYVGDMLAKSKTWRTRVKPALPTPSETAPPEPEQGWVEQVLAAKQTAEKAAADAKADADRVSSLAAEVAVNAAQTAQDASKATKAMEAAQTAQRLAEEAQGAAEAARTAAAAAQSAAEKAATDAAAAKQGAETAMQAAQEAAAAAANALEAIRTLYREMQTWAQGVIQDVNAAGSAAVQSVQSAGDEQVQRVTDEGTTQTANAKAQANAAAQSASGAAQSAQEAAESAAVYDDVVADVTQLKQDVAAITPDDNTVDGKPWTSKKIVDSLCMPFEESGNPVQCYPVENYPLGVKVSWEPTQEGEGDPSPDNIRPITGRNSVTITHSNDVVSNDYNIALPETVYGGEMDAVSGEWQETWKIIDLANATISLYGINQYGIANFSLDTKLNNIHTTSVYNDDYFTSSLPEDTALFSNATKIGIYKANASTFYIRLKETDAKNVEMAKAYLASINAKLVYKLSEPVPFTATGTQPIPALSGVNTLYTDADGVIVTGAEDPKHTITELKNAIISLGGNV